MPLLENIKRNFKKKELKGLALDAYFVSEKLAERTLANKGFVYGYKKKRSDGIPTDKFATLMNIGGPTLVLHIGEKADGQGLEMQGKVDKRLGKVYERSEMQIREKPHEVFIRLEWVHDLMDIKEFIDEVYEKRR
ncbi:hypothetical protein [Pseudobacillus badius]|uniref:hypothetical protein n=1 Tax=Bacillus badius TaxID=1455 RepID=UPI0005ADC801|nr:hypothetical protein [Bacillus badius]KIL74873.1 hypothetical protein SD78_1942 [Bacillus badius]KZR60041.1 hypothetical protein A3781_07505 [Bacillus badius]